MRKILSILLFTLLRLQAWAGPAEISLNGQTGHVQGIAWDEAGNRMFFSATTKFIITDTQGEITASIEGLHGHLGSMVFDSASRKVYASMECKDDVIGSSISRQLGVEGFKQSTFYIAEIDVDAVTQVNTPAEKAITYHEVRQVAEDYAAEVTVDGKTLKHRYGCSGIDGITIAPDFGGKGGRYLYLAYGIYSDTTRTDNDYQILLQYRLDRLDRPRSRFFIKTGNTTYGIQNLAYDDNTDKMFMVVYRGRKSQYPNYDIFTADMSDKPRKGKPDGIPYEKGKINIVPPGQDHWMFRWGKQGLCPLGNGEWYITEDSSRKNADGKTLHDCTVRLYRWNLNGESPFSITTETEPPVLP